MASILFCLELVPGFYALIHVALIPLMLAKFESIPGWFTGFEAGAVSSSVNPVHSQSIFDHHRKLKRQQEMQPWDISVLSLSGYLTWRISDGPTRHTWDPTER